MTNLEKLADQLHALKYAEMTDLAEYLSDAVSQWIEDGEPGDAADFATLLLQWASLNTDPGQ